MPRNKGIGQVRIIGGSLRGRKVIFSDAPYQQHLRPTSDRIRETLFNWLSTVIIEKECLDAFAGSGALAFEAISRGAKHVSVVEQCPQTMQEIQENAERFNVHSKLNFFCLDTLTYLRQTQQTFDIIFLDPPFQSTLLLSTIQCIIKRELLRPDGILYVESDAFISVDCIPKQWVLRHAKKAGNVCYALFSYPSRVD